MSSVCLQSPTAVHAVHWRRKVDRDEAEVTSSGKPFQALAPAIGKARLPTVCRRKDGTSSWLDDADRSLRRLDMSATSLDRTETNNETLSSAYNSVVTVSSIKCQVWTQSGWHCSPENAINDCDTPTNSQRDMCTESRSWFDTMP